VVDFTKMDEWDVAWEVNRRFHAEQAAREAEEKRHARRALWWEIPLLILCIIVFMTPVVFVVDFFTEVSPDKDSATANAIAWCDANPQQCAPQRHYHDNSGNGGHMSPAAGAGVGGTLGAGVAAVPALMAAAAFGGPVGWAVAIGGAIFGASVGSTMGD
jgi:hypothetical protein